MGYGHVDDVVTWLCSGGYGICHVVEAMGYGYVVEAMGYGYVVEAMGYGHVVRLWDMVM